MGDSGMTEASKQYDNGSQGVEEYDHWDKTRRFFLDNPTLALTLLYLYVAAVGIVYSASLYGSFGINILDYSEIVDFLLAAFKNPATLMIPGITLFTFIFTMIVDARYSASSAQARLKARQMSTEMSTDEVGLSEEDQGRIIQEYRQTVDFLANRWRKYVMYMSWLLLLYVLLSLSLFPYLLGTSTASSIKNGENSEVRVQYRSFKGSEGQVTVPGVELIGGTQKVVFFYDADAKRTIVIPQAQIVSIEVPE